MGVIKLSVDDIITYAKPQFEVRLEGTLVGTPGKPDPYGNLFEYMRYYGLLYHAFSYDEDNQYWTTNTNVYIDLSSQIAKDWNYTVEVVELIDGKTERHVISYKWNMRGLVIETGTSLQNIKITCVSPTSEHWDRGVLDLYLYLDMITVDTGFNDFIFENYTTDPRNGEDNYYAAWSDDGALKFQRLEADIDLSYVSDCTLPSPVKLTIYGPCKNPRWNHYVDGKKKTYGRLKMSLADNEWVEISTLDGERSIRLFGGGAAGRDVYNQSVFSTKRFIHFESGRNRVIVTASEGYPRYKIEGREYYASV